MRFPFHQVKLPPRVTPGTPVKAEHHNKLIDTVEKLLASLKYLSLQPSPDLGIRRGPNGTTAWIKNKRRGTSNAESDPLYGSIEIIPDSDPIAYGVRFSKGYLEYQNAGASESEEGVTGTITPEIQVEGNWIPIDAGPEDNPPGPVPLLPLPALDSWTYLRVKTNPDGVPKFDDGDPPVTIESFNSVQKSIHHVRLSPTSGEEDGDYFVLLLQTVADESDPPKPVARKRVTGNRYLPNQLIKIENIGGKREWYEGYMEGPDDKHKFRTAEQLETRGVGLIAPLDPGSPEEPPILDAEGTIVKEGKPAVPPEKEGETLKWKTADGRASGSATENG